MYHYDWDNQQNSLLLSEGRVSYIGLFPTQLNSDINRHFVIINRVTCLVVLIIMHDNYSSWMRRFWVISYSMIFEVSGEVERDWQPNIIDLRLFFCTLYMKHLYHFSYYVGSIRIPYVNNLNLLSWKKSMFSVHVFG